MWSPLIGSIESTSDIRFLPQRPYFTRQSLRAQITLPDPPDNASDATCYAILEKLQITSILKDTVFRETRKPKRTLLGRLLKGKEESAVESPSNHTNPLDQLPQRSWYKTLSPGNQQLLAFCRVLYHNPRVVIMDEATSAVSEECTARIYALLAELGACYLSVSHDESLERFHDRVIVIAGDGQGWSYKNIEKEGA